MCRPPPPRCHHVWSLLSISCTIAVYLLKLMNLHWHYHPQSIVYIKAHSWCCTFYRFGQCFNDIYLLLQCLEEYFHCPEKSVVWLFILLHGVFNALSQIKEELSFYSFDIFLRIEIKSGVGENFVMFHIFNDLYISIGQYVNYVQFFCIFSFLFTFSIFYSLYVFKFFLPYGL